MTQKQLDNFYKYILCHNLFGNSAQTIQFSARLPFFGALIFTLHCSKIIMFIN